MEKYIRKMKLKIYLADLVYDTIKTNYVVPLNIGYIAAYLDSLFGEKIDIKLFKYPNKLIKAINENPPDILGLSHYSWNSNLCKFFANFVKKKNNKIITIMGGPNIRINNNGIYDFLTINKSIDYYVMFEGEEPIAELIKNILNKNNNIPKGVATIVNNKFIYESIDFIKKSKEINIPSPYLTGWLDEFIKNSEIIPLIETNRGCPFGCSYCTWGISALSKLRLRNIDVIKQEIEYIGNNSAGQVNWIVCDANFGILPRDEEIAKIIRNVMDKKGFPIVVTIWDSKNTGDRNINIAKIIGTKEGYIAIQSSDPVVLNNCGRGSINVLELKKQIDYYHKNNLNVSTDILIGLPGETANSHLTSLKATFNMGFSTINCYNIRLLSGSKYETDEERNKYNVIVKYRPIFGAYGVYNGEKVFEIEESVRATKDMTEEELNNFKIIHWMIYFGWNVGMFKPILLFGKKYGINPVDIFYKLLLTDNILLKEIFIDMKKMSTNEWFDSKMEMINYYNNNKNFNLLVNNFVKLNYKFIAMLYNNQKVIKEFQKEIINIIQKEIKKDNIIKELVQLSNKLVCKNLFIDKFIFTKKITGETASIIMNNSDLIKKKTVNIKIFRPKKYIDFCKYNLTDMSIQNLSKFLEMGGMETLTNQIEVV